MKGFNPDHLFSTWYFYCQRLSNCFGKLLITRIINSIATGFCGFFLAHSGQVLLCNPLMHVTKIVCQTQKQHHLLPSCSKGLYKVWSSFRSIRKKETKAPLLPSPPWSRERSQPLRHSEPSWDIGKVFLSWLLKSPQTPFIYLLKWTKLCQMSEIFIKVFTLVCVLICWMSPGAPSTKGHQG